MPLMNMDHPPPYEHSQENEKRRTASQLRPVASNDRHASWIEKIFRVFPQTSSPRNDFSESRPITLRQSILLVGIIVPVVLIIVLQTFLERSQRDGGIFFAPNMNDLPLQKFFCYLYHGTSIAILYSIFWAWIHLDTKRLEPFHQLSKPQGLTGKDYLLHHPFDVNSSVPIKATMHHHWPVFWASLCVVLVSWGVTPSQAGIFATEIITRRVSETVLVSTGFLPTDRQRIEMAANFTHSAFGITWLNETPPPFTTPQYVLAPFKLETNSIDSLHTSENVTATTRLYSVDIHCEPATIFTPQDESEVTGSNGFSSTARSYYMSSTGCKVPRPYGPTGNDTIGGVGVEGVKKYTSFYAGYNVNPDYTNYYLKPYCSENVPRTFMASFTENKAKESDPANTPTVLFCNSTYYYKKVQATVGIPDNNIIGISALETATELPDDMFNVTDLEYQMNSARQENYVRGEIPGSVWPDQTEMLSTTDISLGANGAVLPFMSALSIGAWKNNSHELLLEPEYLRQSYQAAYRILFARMMHEVLDSNLTQTEKVTGTRVYRTQAVVMVPAFTYVVEVLLGAIILVCLVLLCVSFFRPCELRADSASLAGVMPLVADDDNLLKRLSRSDYLKAESSLWRATTTSTEKPKSVYPYELRFLVTSLFTCFQLAVLIGLITLWVKSKPYGLPLSSQNQFVRQLLESYLPPAIAILVWLVIARLFAELHSGPVPVSRCLTLEHTSLPPRLLCTLVLLANLLAISFSGLFFENTIHIPESHLFRASYADKFVAINGTVGPQYAPTDGEDHFNNPGAFSGGSGLDQFYMMASNITAGTPLPEWSDERYFYVPFQDAENSLQIAEATERQLDATTTAFSADLSCTELRPGIGSGPNSYNLTITNDLNNMADMKVTMQDKNGEIVTCSINNTIILNGPIPSTPSGCPRGPSALELILSPDVSGSVTSQAAYDFCSTLVLAVWARHSAICNRKYTDLTSMDTTLALGCQPSLAVGAANVAVNSKGQVQRVDPFKTTTTYDESQHFSNEQRELFRQAHQYYINNQDNNGEGTGRTWHNDSLPSDFHNYLIAERNMAGLGRTLLDPRSPVPSAASAAGAFADAYAEIFAIWLASHKDQLLLPREAADDTLPGGRLLVPETRIFMSNPMFAVAVAILLLYVGMPLVVRSRQPGRSYRR